MPIDDFLLEGKSSRNPYEDIGWAVIFKGKLTGVALSSLDINVEDLVPLYLLMAGEFSSLTTAQVERIRTIVEEYEHAYKLGS